MVAHDQDKPVRITTQTGPWALVPVWVLAEGLSGADLAVYVALRSYADFDRTAWPHIRTIAARAHVSHRTVERAITRFRTLGLLHTTPRHRSDGSLAGLTYTLTDIPPSRQP